MPEPLTFKTIVSLAAQLGEASKKHKDRAKMVINVLFLAAFIVILLSGCDPVGKCGKLENRLIALNTPLLPGDFVVFKSCPADARAPCSFTAQVSP
jgi:hypothetical protein